jgi:sterol 14-demethylase
MRLSHRVSVRLFSLFHHQLNLPFVVIPCLLEDTRKMMESWGSLGQFDPFENVYQVSTYA